RPQRNLNPKQPKGAAHTRRHSGTSRSQRVSSIVAQAFACGAARRLACRCIIECVRFSRPEARWPQRRDACATKNFARDYRSWLKCLDASDGAADRKIKKEKRSV